MLVEVELPLSHRQAVTLLKKHKNVRLTAEQLQSDGMIHLRISPKMALAIDKAVKGHRGVTLKHSEVEEMDDEVIGGKIRVLKDLKKFGNKYVAPALTTVQKVVPRKTASLVASNALGSLGAAGAAYVGMDPKIGYKAGTTVGKSGVDAFYDTDFKKRDALNKLGRNFGNELVDNGKSMALQSMTASMSGAGVKRYAKGSPEMKARMAHLRSLRKTGNGFVPI